MKLLISVDLVVWHHSSVVQYIVLVNRRFWFQIRGRLLLKVTVFFWKSYFYQKVICRLLFRHYVTSLFIIKLFRFYQGVMSHLNRPCLYSNVAASEISLSFFKIQRKVYFAIKLKTSSNHIELYHLVYHLV